MILSLQGGMAAGKTTALRYLESHCPPIHIGYEDNADVIHTIKKQKLDKHRYEDYLKIQRLWLAREVVRYHKAKAFPCSILDYGAEEIEFYTLHYPLTIGQTWDVETPLQDALEAVRTCMPDRILFLDASDDVLKERKAADHTRSRGFFEHHLTRLLPLKRQWFLGKENVDILPVDHLSREEMGVKVLEWVNDQLHLSEGATAPVFFERPPC